MYKNINDYEQLYLVCENNDEEATKVIYEKYRPIIIALANKYYVLIKDKSDIEDFIQEGYIGLSKAISSFKETADVLFYTFCTICIERQIRAYYRKLTTQKNFSINTAYSLDAEIEDFNILDTIKETNENVDPVISTEKSYYYNEITKFKNSLDTLYSQVFELRFNGFKYKEIATLLDIPVSLVDNYIHTIKEKLKNYMTYL